MDMKKVLNEGYVRLVDVMGNDLSVVNSARVSYNKAKDELDEKDKRLIRFLAREGHTSPFRHASLQFEVYADGCKTMVEVCGGLRSHDG